MDFDLFRHNFMILSLDRDVRSSLVFETAEDVTKQGIRLPDVSYVVQTYDRLRNPETLPGYIVSNMEMYNSYVIWLCNGQLNWTIADY